MPLNKAIPILLFLSTSTAVANEPAILFDKVAGINTPVALLNLEAPFTDCRQQISEIVIDEVSYTGTSEIIEGFRVNPSQASNGITLYRINNNTITSGQMRELNNLIRKKAHLFVLSQTCGSGQFTTVRELWSKRALNK